LADLRAERRERSVTRLTGGAPDRAALQGPCVMATAAGSHGRGAGGIRLAPSKATHDGGRGALNRKRGASGRGDVSGAPRAAPASAGGRGALVLVTGQFP